MIQTRLKANITLGTISISGWRKPRIDFLNEDGVASVLNVAMDFGKVVRETKGREGGLEYIEIEIESEKEKRFMKEYSVLAEEINGRPRKVGELGYILGLHSEVDVAVDQRNNLLKRGDNYEAIVCGKNFTSTNYMHATLTKEVVEELDSSKATYIEDYIYLRQFERIGKAKAPGHIKEEAFRELFESLTKDWYAPSLLMSRQARKFIIKRYVGIALGLMVAWGYAGDVPDMVAVATEMGFNNEIQPEIYKSLVSALKFAEKLGDVKLR